MAHGQGKQSFYAPLRRTAPAPETLRWKPCAGTRAAERSPRSAAHETAAPRPSADHAARTGGAALESEEVAARCEAPGQAPCHASKAADAPRHGEALAVNGAAGACGSAAGLGASGRTTGQPLDGEDCAAVWRAVCMVPMGNVCTYGELARAVGGPWSPVSVGQALKQNPYAPVVPCHRVVRADRTLGGYFGATVLQDPRMQAKVRLLVDEGVALEGAGSGDRLLVPRHALWRFPKQPKLEEVLLPGEDGGPPLPGQRAKDWGAGPQRRQPKAKAKLQWRPIPAPEPPP